MRQMALFLSLLLLAPLADLAAQEVSPLTPGARVRIKADSWPYQPFRGSQWLVGSVVSLNADTLVLKAGKRDALLAIPFAYVTRLDVSRGQVPHGKRTEKGAIIGALSGGTVGTLSMYAYLNHLESDSHVHGDLLILGFILGSVPSAVIGGIVGSKVGGERWKRVPLERVRLSIAPQRQGGVRLAASFTF